MATSVLSRVSKSIGTHRAEPRRQLCAPRLCLRLGEMPPLAVFACALLTSTGDNRRQAGWDARGVVLGADPAALFCGARGGPGPADAAMAEPAVTLPPQTEGETVIEDYRAIS